MNPLPHNLSDDQGLPAGRLRRPVRDQVESKFEAVDDLVGPDHPVRRVWTVVSALDLSAFTAPIKARAGVGGRNSTDPRLLVALECSQLFLALL